MGQPVVHFEIMGGPEKLWSYYSDLFGWEFDSDNPMNYGTLLREGNLSAEGVGIGGGVGAAPLRGTQAMSPSISRCPM